MIWILVSPFIFPVLVCCLFGMLEPKYDNSYKDPFGDY